MKKILITLSLVLSINSFASIEAGPLSSDEPTAQEINISRGCFEYLDMQGCRSPRDDHEQFRSCLRNVIFSMTVECQKKMLELYGK